MAAQFAGFTSNIHENKAEDVNGACRCVHMRACLCVML